MSARKNAAAATICGIYFIICLANSSVYIGSSIDVRRRILEHFYECRKGVHTNQIMQRTYNKYGASAFEAGLLELAPRTTLRQAEQFWLDLGIGTMNIAPHADNSVRLYDCCENRVCEWCHEDYIAYNARQKYCSVRCSSRRDKHAAKKRKEMLRECANPRCAKQFVTTDARKIYCGIKCAHAPKLVQPTPRVCRQCSNTFYAKGPRAGFCGRACTIYYFNRLATFRRRAKAVELQVTETCVNVVVLRQPESVGVQEPTGLLIPV